MDDYTDTKLYTDNWTTLGLEARGVVSKIAAGERIGKSPPAASPLHHAAEWAELMGNKRPYDSNKDRSDGGICDIGPRKAFMLTVVDFGFVFIPMWHRRQPFVWIVGIQISARA